jgi:hypothetical protein
MNLVLKMRNGQLSIKVDNNQLYQGVDRSSAIRNDTASGSIPLSSSVAFSQFLI